MKCWDIIKNDILEATELLFEGYPLPSTITSMRIILIPKNNATETFADYRPISLCNFSNKIMSKLIANRLADILPSIISPEQSGFVWGREIADNIVLAQELITNFGHKHWGEHCSQSGHA